MKAVSDLDRIGSRQRRSGSVVTSPVAAYHFHLWMAV
jgi:hypothetical protein